MIFKNSLMHYKSWRNQDFECGRALLGPTDEIPPGGEAHKSGGAADTS